MNRRERASLHSAEQPFALLRPTRSSETLIFLPTYNECDTLGRMIDALLALPIACDVLVVDDRSTDGTTGILGALNLVRLTLRRKWQNRYALAGGVAHDCPACHQPFLIPAPSGELVWVACSYREP
jgi:hypothetical protein